MRNIVLLVLSPYKDDNKEEQYKYIDKSGAEHIFLGEQTNDAPFRCIMHELRVSNEVCDTVMILCSDRVKTEQTIEGFKERVLKEYSLEDKIKVIDVSDNPGEDEIIEKSIEISESLTANDNLYMDMSGGYRDFNFLLMAVLRFSQVNEIKIKKIVMSNHSNKLISDRTKIYEMYNFISASDEFIHFGKTQKLFDYYTGTDNEKILGVLQAMKAVEEALTLCDHQSIQQTINKLSKSIDTYYINNRKRDILFEKFLEILEQSYRQILSRDVDILDIIGWCVDRDFLQSALSFWTEQIPYYIIQSGLLRAKESIKIALNGEQHSPEYDFINHLRVKEVSETISSEIKNCFYYDIKSGKKEINEYVKNLKKINKSGTTLDYIYKTDISCRQIINTVIDVCKLNNAEVLKSTNKKPIIGNALSNLGVIRKIICDDTKQDNKEEQVIQENLYSRCVFNLNFIGEIIGVLQKYYLIKECRNSVHHANKASITKEELKAIIKKAVSEMKTFVSDLAATE